MGYFRGGVARRGTWNQDTEEGWGREEERGKEREREEDEDDLMQWEVSTLIMVTRA